MDLDDVVVDFASKRASPIFGIANVQGFNQTLPDWHPKELMPNVRVLS